MSRLFVSSSCRPGQRMLYFQVLRTHCYRIVLLLGFLVVAPQAQATVVSRLGAIYLYDPMSFDAGVLQRGGYLRLGAGTDGTGLETGIDLPFFRDFSLRLGLEQATTAEGERDQSFVWRARLPIVETARYGVLSSVQLGVIGRASQGDVQPLSPRLELHAASSRCYLSRNRAWSYHVQTGVLFREAAQAESEALLSPIGIVQRAAWIFQLYSPPRGIGGKWTLSFSVMELEWMHYGLGLPIIGKDQAGEGQLELSPLTPTLHFSHNRATYSLGITPQARVRYGGETATLEGGLLMGLTVTYRTFLE